MQKLLKPLEPVEEEIECSEITTPASEAVECKKRPSQYGKHKRVFDDEDLNQTSIMSSNTNSQQLIETA